MKKGKNYTHDQISTFANENDYDSLEEFGNNTIGENFIFIKHKEKDITISFVLTGVGGNGYEYECIYSDLK